MEFEERFREVIQRREIKPSPDSWQQLRERLDTGTKPDKRSYSWFWKAAAIAVLFFCLGTLFENPLAPDVVVPVEYHPQTLQNQKENPAEVIPEEPVPRHKQELAVIPARQQWQLAGKTLEQQTVSNAGEILVRADLPEIRNLEKPKAVPEVSDAEIEALLAGARRALSRDSASYNSEAVTAQALLRDVETELNESFRRRVFEILKEGYSMAKTALASREL